VNEGICKPHLNGTKIKIWPSKKVEKSTIKNYLGHTWYNTTYNLGF
jgi:hypothetical protein